LVDYALIGGYKVVAEGKAKNICIDKRDVGKYLAKIVSDDRTLNKKVYIWGDVLSQNEILEITEKVGGEKITGINYVREFFIFEPASLCRQSLDRYRSPPKLPPTN
jgi:hypothetical protein